MMNFLMPYFITCGIWSREFFRTIILIFYIFLYVSFFFFFFQAEDGIRDADVTGVQTCALPILTAIVYVLSIFGLKKGPEYGVYAILGGIVIKLLFALSLFLAIVVKSAENQLVLGLNFFSLYLLFTAFEVIVLLRKLRHQNKM